MLTFLMVFFLVLFIVLGAPIAFVMAAVPTVYVLFTDAIPVTAIPYQMYVQISKFPLVAVPLFLLAGELMTCGGITERLLILSRELVGRVRGGLAQVTVILSMLFASLNGSAVASTAIIGGMMIPAMKKAGYSPAFSAAITSAASTIGGIIPPSIAMVILASIANLSVGRLFSAGILPGILVGLMFMAVAYVISVRRNYERYEAPFRLAALLSAFRQSVLALSLPVILYFGIVGGVFTPTEAAAFVCGLAFFIGKFIFKTLTWKATWEALGRTVRMTASVFIVVAAAGPFSWLLTRLGALKGLESWLGGFGAEPILFLFVFLAIILVAGMVSDIVANLIILGPTLITAAGAAGMGETPAAIAICVGFLLGTVTPPVGICYFTASQIAGEKLERVGIALVPFILAEVVLLALILFIPPITEFIPGLVGF